ncbi:MAG: hypothetical protein WD688_15425 [Candidatus Binatia bacterium]
MFWRKTILWATALAAPLALAGVYLLTGDRSGLRDNAFPVVRSYLRATYAREYREAYRFISAADRRVRDETSYVQAQGAFTGFTLEVARKLADFMELQVIEQTADADRAKVKVAYSVPAAEDLSGLVSDWDSEKLNSLSPAEQKQLLDRLDARKRDGTLVMLAGQENFELVREGSAWKIFQDWAAGTRVKIQTSLPEKSEIDVKLSQKEIITRGEEPFQINLKIRNRGKQSIVMTLNHRIEPREAADDMEMIECGLSRPVALEPGIEQEFSMAYLLGEATRKSVRQLTLTYAFEIKK